MTLKTMSVYIESSVVACQRKSTPPAPPPPRRFMPRHSYILGCIALELLGTDMMKEVQRKWKGTCSSAQFMRHPGAEIQMQNGSQIKRADEILNTSLSPAGASREQSWKDCRPSREGKTRPPTTEIIRDK